MKYLKPPNEDDDNDPLRAASGIGKGLLIVTVFWTAVLLTGMALIG